MIFESFMLTNYWILLHNLKTQAKKHNVGGWKKCVARNMKVFLSPGKGFVTLVKEVIHIMPDIIHCKERDKRG